MDKVLETMLLKKWEEELIAGLITTEEFVALIKENIEGGEIDGQNNTLD